MREVRVAFKKYKSVFIVYNNVTSLQVLTAFIRSSVNYEEITEEVYCSVVILLVKIWKDNNE
jgi:hypothetical protein